jgi:hypothetical protein
MVKRSIMSRKPPLPAALFVHDKSQMLETSVRMDGMTVVHAPIITWVGVADITQVKEHRISEVMGTVSHAVYFRNGGHLFYSYGIDGGPIELQVNGADIHQTGQGRVMVMPTLDPLPEGQEDWQPFSGKSAS